MEEDTPQIVVTDDVTEPSVNVDASARQEKLLGFNPEHVIGDTFNLVQDYCCDAVDDFSKAIRTQQLASDEGSYALLDKGVEELLKRCEGRSKVYLERFERFSREHCFSVPIGLLAEDEEAALQECSTSDHTDEEESALDERLQQLRCKIAAARSATEALRNEKTLLQKELDECGPVSTALMEVSGAENMQAGIKNITDKVKDLRQLASTLEKYRGVEPLTECRGNIDLQLQPNAEKRVPLEDLCSLNNQLLHK